jgi:SAM-dependent methyltransferase
LTPLDFLKFRIVDPVLAWFDRRIDLYSIANGALRREIAARAPSCRGVLLDVGCGAQPYRDLFVGVERYVAMDVIARPGVSLCGDAQFLPFGDAVFDAVLCNQVLEHVPEPARLMREVARVLKIGGQLLLTAPQTWGLHLEPHDFYRYTKYGLTHLARQAGFEVIEVAPTTGLAATLAQRIVDTVSEGYLRSRRAVFRVPGNALLLQPILWLGCAADRLFKHRGDTLDNVMLATRRADAVPGA